MLNMLLQVDVQYLCRISFELLKEFMTYERRTIYYRVSIRRILRSVQMKSAYNPTVRECVHRFLLF
jgi:hypothetical protein